MSANANSSCATSSHGESQSDKLEESDEELFRVSDMVLEAQAHQPLSNSNNTPPPPQLLPRIGFPEKGRSGPNLFDMEHKRLESLLKNRVSAQQAREREKVYVCDLESRAKQMQDINSKLEENISTLMNENTILRKVLMNTRSKVYQSIEPKNDILSRH